MKKIINTLLNNKKYLIGLIVILVVLGGSATYTLIGISENVKKMGQPSQESNGKVQYVNYPIVNTTGKDPAFIKRGEYLAKAGDCIACHTNTREKGKAYAGGLPMQTPFGTIYSPNITPDKETGIGNWTEAQFIEAMQRGISPTGHYYYPAFPYLYFNRVAVDDLKAIKAYLDSIPAINQKNRENDMVWPFNQRILQLPWRLMFFHPVSAKAPQFGFSDKPQQTDQLKRGAYLVEGLGHCAMCHSPSYHIFTDKLSLGAPIRKYDLTGAKIEGYLAPNITKWNLKNASVEEIIEVFTKDKLIGGGSVQGPMVEVNHYSLKNLERSDLEAIALYLKSVESEQPPQPKVSGGVGAATYETYCSGCHATGAGGAPRYGDVPGWDPLIKGGVAKIYENAIKGIGGMPAKGTCLACSDDDIKATVDYMLLSVKGKHGAGFVPPPKKLTLEDGKIIYQKDCAICHNAGYKNAPKPGDMKAWEKIIDDGFVQAYLNVITGKDGHPVRGSCPTCNDEQLKAAVKYMMQQSTTTKDFSLW